MSIRTLRAALMLRLGRNDDRGSIALLMLVILAGTALGGIMLVSTVSQTRSTTFDITRVHELDAAQAGIDVALGNIRSATSTSDPTIGDDGALPCGPFTGSDGASGATYNTTIGYYLTDPSMGTASPMLCTSAGPYDPSTQTRTPRYALITSTGLDGVATAGASTGRTVQSTYVFQTDDVNITGGQIRIFPAGSSQFCMDAGSNPTVGTAVLLQPCSTSNPPIEQQVWAYRSDLSIELVSSATSTSAGLCLDASPTTHAAGDAIVLKTCTVPDASVCPAGYTAASYATAFPGKSCSVSPWNQQWSVDDNAHLEGALTDQSNLDGYCINAGSQAASVALTLQSCAGGVTDTAQTWVPSPTTGAGMASAGNSQLVNYKQFATCLDVTGQDVTQPYPHPLHLQAEPEPAESDVEPEVHPVPCSGQRTDAGTAQGHTGQRILFGHHVLPEESTSRGRLPRTLVGLPRQRHRGTGHRVPVDGEPEVRRLGRDHGSDLREQVHDQGHQRHVPVTGAELRSAQRSVFEGCGQGVQRVDGAEVERRREPGRCDADQHPRDLVVGQLIRRRS